MTGHRTDLTYFPGCAMVTSALESNASLIRVCKGLGIHLTELKDWNCCGSSSAHSLDPDLAFRLSARNLSLAPSGRPLVAMCPSCLHRLLLAQKRIRDDPPLRALEEKRWGREIDPDLEVFHFLEVLTAIPRTRLGKGTPNLLKGLRLVPYYGCMLNRPPALRKMKNYHHEMERILSALGADPLSWAFSSRCCGAFLAAARPDVATPLVNRVMGEAVKVKADCMVTACAMCQLNLEIRCTLDEKVPILHLSEVLALALGERDCEGWFKRHLVDPRPVLKRRGLL